MDNIEIKRVPNKRSMESLIEDSAIDHEFNYQAHEMRRAFNLTIRELNSKVKDQDREIQKLKLIINQKDQILQEQHNKLIQLDREIQELNAEEMEFKRINTQLKKRLHHVEYKLQTMEDNRKIVPMSDHEDQSPDPAKKKAIKNEAYKEIQQVLGRRIKQFTKEIRQYPMSNQVQQHIENFLQEIYYLNPQAKSKPNVFNMRSKQIGKIAERKKSNEKVTEQEEWARLEKSLEKLRNLKVRDEEKQKQKSQSRNQIRRQEITPEKRGRKIFVNYV